MNNEKGKNITKKSSTLPNSKNDSSKNNNSLETNNIEQKSNSSLKNSNDIKKVNSKNIKHEKETVKSSKDDLTLQSQEEKIKKNTPKSNKRKKIAVATTATVLIATAIAVPTVVYLSRRKFDVNILTNTDIVEEYTINVKRGVYIRNLTAQQIEGYTFVGFYKDAKLTQPYGENDRVRGDMRIYAKYEINIYSLKFPTSTYFTIEGEAIEGNQVNIEYNTEYQFKINLNAGYTESEITVKANGDIIEADSNGYYTLTVKDDIVIEVEGVAINTYTITFYDETGETIYKIEEVAYNQDSTYKEIPTKHSTPTYNYTFAGWVDSEGNPVDLTNIIVDKDVYASFTEEYIEYRINKIPSQVVIKDSEGIELTGSNTLHYGDIVEITYKASPGYVTNSFSVSGAKRIGETSMYQVIDNILIEYSEEKAINLDFEIRNGVLISYLGTETEIEIPATYSLDESGNVVEGIDYQVVSIGPRAFEGQTNLTSVVLPDSIVMIGDYAFSDCTNLININIPNKIIDIGIGSFSGCESLTSITLPESLVSIGNSAFEDCTGLIEINYNAISVVDLTSSSSAWSSGNSIFDNAGRDASGIVVNIGASVERIPAYLFNPFSTNSWVSTRPKILSIKFDENSKCIEIGDYAFKALDELTEINLPNSLISIGEELFYTNNNLEYNVKDGLKYLGNDINPFLLLMGMEDTTLTDVIIDENCRFLYSSIFNGDNIITVSIPKSVEYIGTNAFRMCFKLTDVYYEGTIYDWMNIQLSNELSNPLNNECNFYINNTELVQELNIDNITEINANSFYGCTSLNKVIIGKNINRIATYAFYNCNNLEEVVFVDDSQINFIDSYAFAECTNLKNVNFGINSKLETMNDRIFYNCTSLVNIILPSELTHLGKLSFYRCTSLENVYFEDNCKLTAFSSQLFYNCNNLKSIEIPENVNSIEDDAFEDCFNLESIIVKKGNSTYHSVNNSIIDTANKILVVGSNSTVIPDDGSVTSIGNYAFNGRNIVSMQIPDCVVSIGSYVFQDCKNLTTITFGEDSQLKTIGDRAFHMCSALVNIELPETLTNLPFGVFEQCSKLVNINIPNAVTSIGRYAFSGCRLLESITISANITNIDELAFQSCSNLEYVIIESNEIYQNAGTSRTECGGLLAYVKEVRVLTSCIGESSNSYLENSVNFTKSIDGEYTVYTKVS